MSITEFSPCSGMYLLDWCYMSYYWRNNSISGKNTFFSFYFSYQTGAFPDMANIQIAAQDITPQNPQELVQPNNGQNQQDDNQNVILDARGRVVENVDNDDEFGQHDWLDYIYTFSRFMVLISIVYFYSNFTRFAVVALFFFIVYL